MSKSIAVTLMAGAWLFATQAAAGGAAIATSDAPSLATANCQSCHGPKGDSTSSSVPRLNGQQADYIVARLKNFLDPTREDPHAMLSMWDVVSNTNNSTFTALAEYYAVQTPAQSQSSGPFAAAGRKIYTNGDSSRKIPACAACHGAGGEGAGATPRLAGQHAEYLTNQLERFRLAMRESGTMHNYTNNMTDSQIKDVVAYLANDAPPAKSPHGR